MYVTFVTSLLSYGCEAWGFTPGVYLERLHLTFCKQILAVKQNCQNDFVYGELGRYPLIVTTQYRMITF